jgi:hypothetical protein
MTPDELLKTKCGRGADLRNAYLHGANLHGADLRNADLRGATLLGANLRGATLRNTDLRGATLRNADLYGADLRNADLRNAALLGANLLGADLRNAALLGANLRGADLYGADLRNADLRNADLRNADLRGANLPVYSIVPTGTFTAYKKASGCVVTVIIPAAAKRTSTLTSRKCRAEFVYVKRITDIQNPDKNVTEVRGNYDSDTIYRVGTKVEPDRYCDDIRLDCSHGINFFITYEEAERY